MKPCIIVEMEPSTSMDRERQSLVDYVKFCAIKYSNRVSENLNYVVSYLHSNSLPFMKMLRHAKNLRGSNSTPSEQYDIEKLVAKLTEKELPIVKDYMYALGAYLSGGTSFKPVDEAANELSYSKPIPASAKHTPTELDILMEKNWD